MWNCGDDLRYAKEEVEHLRCLRSPECEVTEVPTLKWKDLGGFAAAVEPTIFHFIGHGDSKGNLTVRGSSFSVPAVDVIRKVCIASQDLKGVYLSACFSAVDGPQLLDFLPPAGGWAIGTGLAVDDDQAEQFSKMFYQHLIADALTPRKAYDLAHSHIATNWGSDDVVQSAWFNPSQLPAVDRMVQDIDTAIRVIFSRSAFRFPMRDEGSIKELEDALDDVSYALATGQVVSRKHRNTIQPSSFPAAWLHAPEVEGFVITAMRRIALVRDRLAVIKAGALNDRPAVGNQLGVDDTATREQWMERMNEVDAARNRVLKAANKLFERGNLAPLAMIKPSYTKKELDAARSSAGNP